MQQLNEKAVQIVDLLIANGYIDPENRTSAYIVVAYQLENIGVNPNGAGTGL